MFFADLMFFKEGKSDAQLEKSLDRDGCLHCAAA